MRFMICFAFCLSVCVTARAEDLLEIPTGLKKMRIPKGNPLTAEKISLGKQLFFDKRLSRDNCISCASCHDPNKGWSNNEPFATGIDGQVGGRNTPTIINSGYQRFQFWDGRAKSLEEQALGPIVNPIEMDLELANLVKKLNGIEGYRAQFQDVFGTDVTTDGIAKAIASFERTILSGNAPYDHFKAGNKDALSKAAQRGSKIFFNKANCSSCHSGSNFTDGGFHNLGVGIAAKQPDVGRFTITKMVGDRGSFKTPTLREIARSAPYMHDGRFATLEEVIEFYDQGGTKNPQLDEEIFPLELTAKEKSDLVIFLKEGLSSENYPDIKPPQLPN